MHLGKASVTAKAVPLASSQHNKRIVATPYEACGTFDPCIVSFTMVYTSPARNALTPATAVGQILSEINQSFYTK